MTTAFDHYGRGAVRSEDGLHRYLLTRTHPRAYPAPSDDHQLLTWVMLNPSTADHRVDDPTIRRCLRFAEGLGLDGIRVANLFSFRATSPRDLWERHSDLRNTYRSNWYVREALALARRAGTPVVAAWGADVRALPRAEQVVHEAYDVGVDLHAYRLTANGHPGHPLYLPAALEPFVWRKAPVTA